MHLISSQFKLEFWFKTLASQTHTNTCTQTSRHWRSIRIKKKKKKTGQAIPTCCCWCQAFTFPPCNYKYTVFPTKPAPVLQQGKQNKMHNLGFHSYSVLPKPDLQFPSASSLGAKLGQTHPYLCAEGRHL